MSESIGIDNLPKRVAIGEAKGPDVSNLGIYNNLPDKLAGLGEGLEKIDPEQVSFKAFTKRVKRFYRRCKTLDKNVEVNKKAYIAKFGQDVVEKAKQDLEDFRSKLDEIRDQGFSHERQAQIEKLRQMGYDE